MGEASTRARVHTGHAGEVAAGLVDLVLLGLLHVRVAGSTRGTSPDHLDARASRQVTRRVQEIASGRCMRGGG